jgi:hypothetical protein
MQRIASVALGSLLAIVQLPRGAPAPAGCPPTIAPTDFNRSLPASYVDQAAASLPRLFPKGTLLFEQRSSTIGRAAYSLIIYKVDAMSDATNIEGVATVENHAWKVSATCGSTNAFDGLSATLERIAALRAPTTADGRGTALFGAWGGVGLRPMTPPSGYATRFAVAVVEMASRTRLEDQAVGDFVLDAENGQVIQATHVVSVERFTTERAPGQQDAAYYLCLSDLSRWDGTLPNSPLRLRIRASIPNERTRFVRFHVTIGPYVITGPMFMEWGTS